MLLECLKQIVWEAEAKQIQQKHIGIQETKSYISHPNFSIVKYILIKE